MTITPADIEAAIQVLDQLTEESDDLSGQSCVEMIAALRDLTGAARRAEAMVKTRGQHALDGQPISYRGSLYVYGDKVHESYDHAAVAREVADAALVDRRTGEVFEGPDAVRRAVRLTQEIYVSPSSKPKITGLRAIHSELPSQVISEEVRGQELKVIPLKARQ